MDNNSKPNSNAVFYLISDKFAFNVEHSCTLGRTRADIIIKDEKLSGVHCEFILKNAGCYVVDCESRNGTFLNNEQLAPGRVVKLKVGDKLKLGSSTYVVKYGISTVPDNVSVESEASSDEDNADSSSEVEEMDSSSEESVDDLYEEVYGSEVKKEKKVLNVKKDNKDKISQKNSNEVIEEKKNKKQEISKEELNEDSQIFFVVSNLYDFFEADLNFSQFRQKYKGRFSFFNTYTISFIIFSSLLLYVDPFSEIEFFSYKKFGNVIPQGLIESHRTGVLKIQIFTLIVLYLSSLFHAYLYKFKFKTRLLINRFSQFFSLLFSLILVLLICLRLSDFSDAKYIERYSFLRYSIIAISFYKIERNEDEGLLKEFHSAYNGLSKALSAESRAPFLKDYNSITAELENKKNWHISHAFNSSNNNLYISGSVFADTPAHRLRGSVDSYVLKFEPNESVSWVKFFGEYGTRYSSLNTIIDKMENVYVFLGARGEVKTSKSFSGLKQIVKITNNGEVAWEKKITDADDFGEYVGSGITNSGLLYILSKKKSDPRVDLIKFYNLEGVQKSSLEFIGTSTNTLDVLINKNDEIITASQRQKQFFITKRDISGKILSEASFFDDNPIPRISKIYEDNEGNIYALGLNHPVKEALSRSQLFIYKLKSNGQRSSQVFFAGNGLMTYGSDLLVDSQSRLIVTGVDLAYSLTDLSKRYYRLINLVYDQNLKLVRTIYGPKVNASFHPIQVYEDSNKTIHVLGNISDPSAIHFAHPDYDFFHYKFSNLDEDDSSE